jgi:DNA-directed RNA polymerase specialized sigma24 family protein
MEQAVMTAWTQGDDPSSAPQQDADLAELLRQAADGEGDVWGELVDRYGGVVLAAARAHGLGDGEVADVAWLTWTSAVEHVHQLTDPERFAAWLTAVAHEESQRVTRTAALRIPADGDLPAALRRDSERRSERERLLIALLRREPTRRCCDGQPSPMR